ncbi:MAG: 50S ribosomal protein L29 [Ruminococcaceae bacterium]|nr:50S ribosomal protein L29 [Oscillospiraceae bacterium]
MKVNMEEFRDKSSDELKAQLKEKKNELFNLRFQLAINQLANPNQIPETKKTIARIMTVLREKEIAAQKGDSVQ